ncbi:acyltransferase family-domain-containing protein [Nemania sp. FL0916]|nr:acyltransferase family-domain-containing protein [Nemania sp. FL0916]
MGRSEVFEMAPTDEEKCRPLLVVEERLLPTSDSESEGSHVWRETDARFRKIPWAATTRTYASLILRRTAIFLLPSFTHHRLLLARDRHSSSSSSSAKTLSPTSYLDGMRGVAALFVFFCHYFYTSFFIAEGFHYLPPPPKRPDSPSTTSWPTTSQYKSLWRLPFARLLYSGPSMVCVFFVISGYALSLRPLTLSRQRRGQGQNGEGEAAFARTISSLVFRRFFRLYLPPIISTLTTALLLNAGAFEPTRDFVHDRKFMRNVIEHHPPRLASLGSQLAHWGQEMWAFVHIWGWEDHAGSTEYDVHLWTIPLEFRCSMVLFLVLVGTARLRENVRLVVIALLAWFVMRSDRWEMLLFLAGMMIAELDLRRDAHGQREREREGRGGVNAVSVASSSTPALQLLLAEEKIPSPPSVSRRRSVADSFWTLISVLALYLLSCPDAGPSDVPGWRTLGTLIPTWFSEKYRFWQVMGACLFVFCAARSRFWRHIFELPAIQYLGHLSYAVYLMHGPVTHILGYPIQRWAWGITGTEGSAYKSGAILAALINIPLVIWAADIFWRAVDVPTVRFAKWLESKLSI